MKKIYLILLVLFIPLQTLAESNLYKFKLTPEFPNLKDPRALYYEIKPGEKVVDSLILKNNTGSPVIINVFGVDSKDGSDKTFKAAKDTQQDIGLWLKTDENRINLEKDEQKTVKITINVPKNAEKEKTYNGAVVYYRDTLSDKSSEIKSIYRYTIKTSLKVTDNPQPVEKLPPPSTPFPWAQVYFYVSLGLFALVALYFVGKSVKTAHHKRKHGHTKP